MQDLVDSHIFEGAQRVTDALRRHDCSEALAWCKENRTRLKKVKSPLEFKLAVQVCACVPNCMLT
jgi:macrophage erythroblast attacher